MKPIILEATAEYFVNWELCTRHPSNHVNEVLWPLLLKRSELGLALSLFSVCHGIKGMFAEVNLEKKMPVKHRSFLVYPSS